MKQKWWKQELIAIGGILVVVIVVYLVIESGKMHTRNIAEGRVYFEYEDCTIDKVLSAEDLEAICKIFDGEKFDGDDIKSYADPKTQIILGNKAHLYIVNEDTYFCKEKNNYICISQNKGEKMREILLKYGCRLE